MLGIFFLLPLLLSHLLRLSNEKKKFSFTFSLRSHFRMIWNLDKFGIDANQFVILKSVLVSFGFFFFCTLECQLLWDFSTFVLAYRLLRTPLRSMSRKKRFFSLCFLITVGVYVCGISISFTVPLNTNVSILVQSTQRINFKRWIYFILRAREKEKNFLTSSDLFDSFPFSWKREKE